MKHLSIIIPLCLADVGEAVTEIAPMPINVLEWFDGCAQLTQSSNGMVMDINCADLAIEYCTTGRAEDKRLQCLANLSEHIVSLSTAIKNDLPQKIEGSSWATRNYERKYSELVEDVFGVCDASPIEGVPLDMWCNIYLTTGDWVQWRYLQRLTLEVKQ